MNVVVTGGRGFIGGALVRVLRDRGHVVITRDLPHTDIRRSLAFGSGTDVVVHLAGILGTHELFDHIHDAIDVNVQGTANVLDATRRVGAAYVGITMPDAFPSIYTATKRAAVGLERAFHHTYDVPVSRVRAYNAYGPGQRHGKGHPQKIVPTFATEAWAGRPIPIWGDGTQTVDLIHVDELARLLADAIGHGDDVTFDGGTGIAWTVNDVADMVLDITGSTAGVEYHPMRRGELPTTIVATGDGWDRLDWRPTLDIGALAATVKAYQ